MPDLNIDLNATVHFLTGLLETPSPTGHTVEAIAYVEKAFRTLKIPGLKISITRKGRC